MKINEVILVEGKYDKIKLDSIIDATVIAVNGFSLFKNKEMRHLIKRYALERGIIILTDSDSGGLLIRKHLLQLVDSKYIKNAYIPQIAGKEKRKAVAGKAGLLGVEGMTAETILKALERCGYTEKADTPKITKADFVRLGLSGSKDASERRAKLLEHLDLPKNLSANAFLNAINTFMTIEELENFISTI
ncbi:MAG: DUF4093 domain-containing protein [Clostridia bacterium]|nr:DUF4093 domain-containing protein [Clostridia bacterium]